ncbi:hypothetical protein D9O40_06725 [Clostridium autoethanogenum]|uniref:Uncharacterized protein n=1 Tax=Clostridium autoethanogenum TaxID=84023 RepID=A0A3M0SWR8_9CLOT|nr:hypothetical protein [Clostridium autoethanogenum]RMD02325.1 hypothetical protein D9O40_06725 [Clostridium autoethanogenum]
MEYIRLILFTCGFLIILITLISILIKTVKSRKTGILPIIIIIIGIIVLASGIEFDKIQNIVLSRIANKIPILSKIKKDMPFDAKDSVVPKIENINNSDEKIITDADGSKTISKGGYDLRFSPNNTRHYVNANGVSVDLPVNKKYSDGIHYTEYTFSKDEASLNESIYVESENMITKNYDDANEYTEDKQSVKVEDHSGDGSYKTMSYLDFIRKFVPISTPKTTVAGDFLVGNWVGSEKEILNSKTTMNMNIEDDKTLDLKCSYISNIDSSYGYKVEELGKNAYKLYLYKMDVKADSNGGGTTVSDDPINTTFIIYMKSKNSFDAVFSDNKDKRISVNMTKS